MIKWLKRMILAVLWAASLYFAFGIGALVELYAPDMTQSSIRQTAKLIMALPGDADLCDEADKSGCGFDDASHRIEVPCAPFTADNPRHAIMFAFGQSNSANNGIDRYLATKPVANFSPFDSKCYAAEDPLLGAVGDRGSVWGRVGDQLIDQGLFDRVLIISIGIGGTGVSRWADEKDLQPRITVTLERLAQAGITPTHIVWHQGERDAYLGTSKDAYITAFSTIVDVFRARRITAPIFPAIATHCNMHNRQDPVRLQKLAQPVRAAQQALPTLIDGVWPGPDTDQLTEPDDRYDNCHFTNKGMHRHAQLWANALAAHHQQ